MPRLLAAQVDLLAQHRLDHVAVADVGPHQPDPLRLERPLHAEVAHDRADHRVGAERPAPLHVERAHRQDLIAVDDLAALVDQDHPVGVAVDRDADVRAVLARDFGDVLRVGRAAALVDVGAVGLVPDCDHLGAELLEHGGRDLVGRPVRAVDRDAQALQGLLPWKALLQEDDVTPRGVVDSPRSAEVGAQRASALQLGRAHQGLDPDLGLVRELPAVAREELDPVVLERVVRGADHRARVAAHVDGEEGEPGGRDRADLQHVDPHRAQAGCERVLEHVAGQARVLADQHARRAGTVRAELEHERQRASELEHDLAGHRVDVRAPANPVGAEKLPSRPHSPSLSLGSPSRRLVR